MEFQRVVNFCQNNDFECIFILLMLNCVDTYCLYGANYNASIKYVNFLVHIVCSDTCLLINQKHTRVSCCTLMHVYWMHFLSAASQNRSVCACSMQPFEVKTLMTCIAHQKQARGIFLNKTAARTRFASDLHIYRDTKCIQHHKARGARREASALPLHSSSIFIFFTPINII